VHECHVADSKKVETKKIGSKEYPTVDASHLLWAKLMMDPAYFDKEFLDRIWTGAVPEPQRPPAFWMNMFFENTGVSL
jgi:hypothetical protein